MRLAQKYVAKVKVFLRRPKQKNLYNNKFKVTASFGEGRPQAGV